MGIDQERGSGADAVSEPGTGRELAHHEPGGRAVAEPRQSDNFLAMLLAAAKDPSIDAAKIESLSRTALALKDYEKEEQFAQDFAAALMEMPYISKTNQIIIPAKDGRPERVQGMFASFENLDKVVRPILARHNMVISFKLGSDQGTTCTPIITHTNGYRDVGDALRVPPDTSGSKNAAQAIGSSAQYAKRYAMQAALNIVTIGEDTDGRSYPLEDDPLTDRQDRLIKEAEASHADGNYPEWWSKQKPADRAWLTIKGVHGRLGGASLPDNSKAAPPPPPPSPPAAERRPAPSPPPSPAPGKAKHDTTTPEGWATQYVDDMRAAPDLPAVDRIKQKGGQGLNRLAADHQSLYDKCDAAEMEARERLTPDQSGGGDLFTGDD